jgi:hypothetical protein
VLGQGKWRLDAETVKGNVVMLLTDSLDGACAEDAWRGLCFSPVSLGAGGWDGGYTLQLLTQDREMT